MIGAILGATLALLPAHPLGNFSVNQLVALSLHPDRVEATAVLDLAELPTLQFTPDCAGFARDITVTVDGKPLRWTVKADPIEHLPGAAGLDTSRLTCHLSAPANLTSASSLTVANTHLADRLGWREMTAAGLGATGLPSTSVTNQLRSYPDDRLSSPLDIRSARLTLSAASTVDTLPSSSASNTPNLLTRAESWLLSTVGDRGITPTVGLLAVLLALILGAAHAALPGHGKTVMAVYLAGRAGRPRDAVLVGATVTATHTGGVLLLGLLLTGISSLAGETVLGWLGIASGAIVTAVGAAMLLPALRHRLAHGSHTHARPHSHTDGPRRHTHDSSTYGLHGHTHAHDKSAQNLINGHDHSHGGTRHSNEVHEHSGGLLTLHSGVPGRDTPAFPRPETSKIRENARSWTVGVAIATENLQDLGKPGGGAASGSGSGSGVGGGRRWGVVAIGIAGGLVPSPSALVVLLGAIALGRTGFGVLLVLAYGLGMAGTLTLAGLTLLKIRDRLSGSGRWQLLRRLTPVLPFATGTLVVIVGLGLAARAATLVI